MKNIILILLAFFFTFGALAQLPASSWPMYHGNLQHTGLSAVDTSRINGTIKWTYETGSRIESSPVLGPDGTVYFGDHSNTFWAVFPDGTKKWDFKVGGPEKSKQGEGNFKGILSTPAVTVNGTVYFSSLSDFLLAFDPDGTEKWRFPLAVTADNWSSPTIGKDGTIYIGSSTSYLSGDLSDMGEGPFGKFFALNPDGTEKWNFDTGSNYTSSAAIGPDGTIYIGNYVPVAGIGRVYALNPDGTKKWHFDTDKLVESSPAIGSDGTIYTGTESGRVYAINPDGTEKWYYQTGAGVSAIPAIGADGAIYVGSWDAYFYALDQDGQLKWRFETPETFEAIISSAAIGADGTIYFGSGAGVFYALNPDGTEKWKYESPMQDGFASSPAIGSDGTVYTGTQSGKLIAFGGPGDEQQEEFAEKYDRHEEPGSGNYWIVILVAGIAAATGISIYMIKRKNAQN